jgi:hypothetical protein
MSERVRLIKAVSVCHAGGSRKQGGIRAHRASIKPAPLLENSIVARAIDVSLNGWYRFFRLHESMNVCHDTRMLLYQRTRAERKIAIHVLLRLTAMDVCCGPPRQ